MLFLINSDSTELTFTIKRCLTTIKIMQCSTQIMGHFAAIIAVLAYHRAFCCNGCFNLQLSIYYTHVKKPSPLSTS